jgi:catechol 2,3-dioxygenase-like lactoylglutathione lyase family enzyme
MKKALNRIVIRWPMVLLLLLWFAAQVAAEPKVLAVGPVGLTVADLDRSVDFFTGVLDFRKIDEAELRSEAFDRLTGIFGTHVRTARLQLGQEEVELTEYLTPEGRPIPRDSHSNDLWFQHIAIVVRDMDAAYARLREHKVKSISTEPQRIPDWNQAAAGIRAFYFRDPDSHPLELIWFPEGKGDPRWQRKTDALFLGIDHTAIAVADTGKSLAFYRDTLGLRVAGESLNYGPEQEHLNHVFGSRVKITGLRAPQGPGIEFLEYIVPGGGRPYPADARPNDMLYWQVTLLVEDVKGSLGELTNKRIRFISSEPVTLPSSGGKAMLVRDPDAHALELFEK